MRFLGSLNRKIRFKNVYYASVLTANVAVIYLVLKYSREYQPGRNGTSFYKSVRNGHFNHYLMNQTQKLLTRFVELNRKINKDGQENKEKTATREGNQKSTPKHAFFGMQPSVPAVTTHDTKSTKNESLSITRPQENKLDTKISFLTKKPKLENKNSSQKEQIQPAVQNTRGLNAHVWFLLCADNVAVLCSHPLFPSLPDVRTYVKRLDFERNDDNFVQRIFGFVSPPVSGKYRFGISSDDSSELWFSNDSNCGNSRLLCSVGTRDKPNWSVKNDLFKSFPTQISTEVYLQQGYKYYIEIVHTQIGGKNFLQVAWQKPESKDFEILDEHATSLYKYENYRTQHGESYVNHKQGMMHAGPACSENRVNIQRHVFSASKIHQYLRHNTLSKAMPYCEYKPSYTSPTTRRHKWDFLFPPVRHDTYVFPYLEFSSGVVYINEFPATPLPKEEAEEIVQEYLKKLKIAFSPRDMKLLSILNVEKKLDEKKGSRYLVEAKMQLEGSDQPVTVSEYIFKNSSNGSLCYPKGLQWDRTASIGLVVTIKNQGKWMVHFLNNLEHIYHRTRDRFVSLVVYDYNSTDIDLESALEDRKLPPYKLIRGHGAYSRSRSVNAAVKYFNDTQTIIFTVDLHLELPITLFNDIRKHCFKGLSVYTPIILRLKCGETSAKPKGRWESQGLGMIGVYKSDWDRLGGLDEANFDKLWGGEDWDFVERIVDDGMEYERLRNTNIFHYAHSRKGMWTGDPNINNLSTE